LIFNGKDNAVVFNKQITVTQNPNNTYTSQQVYEMWCAQLGLSQNTSIDTFDDDNNAWLMQTNMSPNLGGTVPFTNSFIYSSEAGLGFYDTIKTNIEPFNLETIIGRGRFYISEEVPLLMFSLGFDSDLRSYNTKWNGNASGYCIYASHSDYDDYANHFNVVIQVKPDDIKIYFENVDTTSFDIFSVIFEGNNSLDPTIYNQYTLGKIFENNVTNTLVEIGSSIGLVVPNSDSLFSFNETTQTITDYAANIVSVVNIPEVINNIDVLNIGANAFANKGITSIIIKDNIVSIGDNAFSNNNYLSSVILEGSSKTLPSNMFLNCDILNIEIGDDFTLTSTTFGANGSDFYTLYNNLNQLGQKYRYTSNEWYTESIFFFDEASNTLTGIRSLGTITDIVIPSEIYGIPVYKIGIDAFRNLPITSVVFPNTITHINDNAFKGTLLTSVTLPTDENNIDGTFIGDEAFSIATLTEVIAINANLGGSRIFYDSLLERITLSLSAGCILFSDVFGSDIRGLQFKNYYYDTGERSGSYVYVNGEWVFEVNDFTFDSQTQTITGYTGTNTVITIPSQINGINVLAIGANALDGKGLTQLTIANSPLTSIGNNAFSNNYLVKVIIEKGGVVFGSNVFSNNNISDIEISVGNIELPENLFINAEIVKITTEANIVFSDTTFGVYGASFRSYYLSKSSIKSEYNYISSQWTDRDARYIFNTSTGYITSFNYTSGSETDLIIPETIDGVTVVGISSFAFYNKPITTVVCPNAISYIGDYAFYGCTQLTVAILPNNILGTDVSEYAFGNTPLLVSITALNCKFVNARAIFSGEAIEVVTLSIPSGSYVSSITFGNGTRGYNLYLYYNSTGQRPGTYVYSSGLGTWILSEGDFDFDAATQTITGYNGTSLNIEIPDIISGIDVLHIADSVFYNKSIETLILPEGILTLGQNTFEGNNIESITIPSTVANLNNGVFKNNTLLKNVILQGATSISNDAFDGCVLTEVYLLSNVVFSSTSFGSNGLSLYTFYNSLTNKVDQKYIFASFAWWVENTIYTFNVSTKTIIAYSGGGVSNLVIPNTIYGVDVDAIGNFVFKLSQISSLTLPNKLKSIGEEAFYINYISSIIFPTTLQTIGSNAFYDNQITQLFLPNSLLSIGYGAFAENAINRVELSSDVNLSSNSISASFYGEYFTNNSSQGGIYVLDTSYYWRFAFRYSDGCIVHGTLFSGSTIVIPTSYNGISVLKVGENVFDSRGITSVTFPNTIEEIEFGAFSNNSITELIFPSSVSTIGDNAFINNGIIKVNIGSNVTLSSNSMGIHASEFYTKYISVGSLADRYKWGSTKWITTSEATIEYNNGFATALAIDAQIPLKFYNNPYAYAPVNPLPTTIDDGDYGDFNLGLLVGLALKANQAEETEPETIHIRSVSIYSDSSAQMMYRATDVYGGVGNYSRIYQDANEKIVAEIVLEQESSRYYMRYKLPLDSYPNNYTWRVPFKPTSLGYLSIQFYPEQLIDTWDKGGITLNIYNNTDLHVHVSSTWEYYYSSRRFELGEIVGNVTIEDKPARIIPSITEFNISIGAESEYNNSDNIVVKTNQMDWDDINLIARRTGLTLPFEIILDQVDSEYRFRYKLDNSTTPSIYTDYIVCTPGSDGIHMRVEGYAWSYASTIGIDATIVNNTDKSLIIHGVTTGNPYTRFNIVSQTGSVVLNLT